MDDQAIDLPNDPMPVTGPDRVLKPGEVEILFVDGERSIIKQDDVQLVDRNFVVGDLARHRTTATESSVGVVTAIETEVKLQGVFSGQPVVDWVPVGDVVNAVRIGRGDHVIASDWIGLVEEVFEEAVVSSAWPALGIF